MAAIQVYKTDTFEIQRQKINQIGLAISAFTEGAGGSSDFSVGNIKLGDGSIDTPSLSFVSDALLGVYKELPNTIGFVSNNKKVYSYSDSRVYSFKDLLIKQRSLKNSELRVLDSGENYDAGVFTNIPLLGGSGTGGTANLEVYSIVGSVSNAGKNYIPGTYTNKRLYGGSGVNAIINFNVDGIEGTINPGSGYDPGAYENLSLFGGSGTGIVVDIVVDINGEVSEVAVTNQGLNYVNGDVLTEDSGILGLSGSGFSYEITSFPGIISDLSFVNRGLDYTTGNILKLRSAVENISADLVQTNTLINLNLTEEQGLASEFIFPGDRVFQTSGTGVLRTNTRVVSVSDDSIEVDRNPQTTGTATLTFAPDYGAGTEDFEFLVEGTGKVVDVSINSGGSGYFTDDLLEVNPEDLTYPIEYDVQNVTIQKLTFDSPVSTTLFPVGSNIVYNGNNYKIWDRDTSGSTVVAIYVDYADATNGSSIFTETDTETAYTISDASSEVYRWVFDTTGTEDYVANPSITFRPNQSYRFLFPENPDHNFSLSKFPGGIWGRSYIQNVNTNVSISSKSFVVPSGLDIQVDMVVNSVSGVGSLVSNSKVVSVDGTTITIDKFPLSTGDAVIEFRGTEYTENIIKTPASLQINVTENTPNLYVYCGILDEAHANEGGTENREVTIVNNVSNPRTTFGSGFSVQVADIIENDIIKLDSILGNIESESIKTKTITGSTLDLSGNLTANYVTSPTVNTQQILSTSNINVTTQNFILNSSFNINSKLLVDRQTGDLTTEGNIKTTSLINFNDQLNIQNNTISSTPTFDINFSPSSSRLVKISTNTALVIPSGTTLERPSGNIVQTGSIRFNTTTKQFEGYDDSSTSWSSLGGVRDVDGNTYILAETFPGANENILYFYNNNSNTIRLSENFFDFRAVKKIRSENLNAPAYTQWTSNTAVTEGQFLKYKNNVYEVTLAGTTAGAGSPPTHTSGVSVNGTSELTWVTLAVSNLIFEEITSIDIDPLGEAPLKINGELNFSTHNISTTNNDLLLSPAEGKKVSINAKSSLVVPVGNSNERGSPAVGSIRYNTDFLSYEGYNGVNWTSLGGVKDVDGNTYIIPETSPGANENILYFYNNNSNTLQLSTTALRFVDVNTITSSSGSLNFSFQSFNLNNFALEVNSSGNDNKIISLKDSLDFDMSIGLFVDTFIKLTADGELKINNAYGQNNPNYTTVLDSDLKKFTLSDIQTKTSKINLLYGTININTQQIYDNTLHSGARITVIAENTSQNKKEIIEFTVCDNDTEVFYTEFGNVFTDDKILNIDFTFNKPSVNIDYTLSTNNAIDDIIVITTIVNSIIK